MDGLEKLSGMLASQILADFGRFWKAYVRLLVQFHQCRLMAVGIIRADF